RSDRLWHGRVCRGSCSRLRVYSPWRVSRPSPHDTNSQRPATTLTAERLAATKGGVRYLANALRTTRSTLPEMAITLSCHSRQALLRPKALKRSEPAYTRLGRRRQGNKRACIRSNSVFVSSLPSVNISAQPMKESDNEDQHAPLSYHGASRILWLVF